jgi:sugar lactone lactonase YvrE
MTFSVRGAVSGRLKHSWGTVRSCALLFLALCVASVASGQAIITGNTVVSFGATPIGTPVSRTLSYQATTATVITVSEVVTNGAQNLDYQLGTNTCTGTILPPNTCTISITFNPTAVGERNGAVVITDSSDIGATKSFLYGVGQGAQFAFAPTNITALNTAPGLNPSTFTASSSVFDGNGNLYFTDIQNGRILERTPTGTISSLASLPVSANSAIAIAPDGTLYVSALGAVYGFLPGSAPVPIVTAGVTLVNPTGLAIDGYAGLFIADSTTGKIARYSLTGSGTAYVTITGLSTPLLNPTGLGVDSNQNLYVADSGNNRIVELNPAVSATMPATVVTIPGFTLSNPSGITIDAAGTLYVADTGNKRILEMTVQPADFALIGAQLTTPVAIAINTTDDLVISDNVLGLVLAPRSTPSITFPTPTIVGTLDTTDDPISLTVQGTGNLPAQLLIPQTGTDPNISTNAFLFGSGATCPTVSAGASTANFFSIGQVCTYPIDFEPTQLGPNMANLVLQTTNPGGTVATTTATVPLLGNAISGITSFSLVASPNVTTIGVPVSLTLTALEANGATATYYVGTVTFTSTDSTGKFLGGTTYTLTAADQGVLSIPAASGIQFNQLGTFTVTATDGTFTAISNTVKVVDTASMTLTSSVNPSQINQSTVFTATITTSGVAATGTVLFFSNGTQIGTGNLVNGVAVLSYAFAVGGTYPITATYAGDNSTEAANAGPLSQVVLFTTSSSAFTSSVNPSLVNQSTTLSLTLSSSGPAPTGTVKFYNGSTLLCTATVTSGIASCPASFATVGSYPLMAVYSGDGSNAPLTAGPLTQVVVNTSSMTLTSSVNPSLINQSTTFTATITTSGVPAGGLVKFFNGTTLLGTGTLSNGIATLTTSFATPGTYPITATYAGDTNTAAANAGPLSQVVLYTTSSNAFTSSVNPSLVNQSTTLSLTLSSSGPAPTGTVKFYNGTTLLCTATVVNGVASCPVSFAAAGSYALTAVYSGDASNAPLTAGPLTQVVVNTVGIALTSSVNPSLVGQSTTLTGRLAITAGVGPTGTINFFDGTTLIGTANVTGGAASISVSFSTVGIHPITAVYSGDTNYATASSAVLPQDVINPVAATGFTSSVNPSLIGQTTVLTLTLSNPAATGTVSFYNGTTLIGTGTVINGVATLATSFSAAGSFPLTAVYTGDLNNSGVTAALTQVVTSATGFTLTSSVNPSLVNQPTTLTATISATGTAPTGTINFFDGTTQIGTGTLANGAVSISVPFATVGIHMLTAVYAGDANYVAATTAPYAQDVVDPATISLVSSINPSSVGQSTNLTATILFSGPQPTGTVTFYDAGNVIGTGTVANGVVTVPVIFTTVGTHLLTAVYSGDTNTASETSAQYSQVVVSASTITLTSSVNPSLVNQLTTLTVTLGSVSATPSGTVTFYDGTTVIGAQQVSGTTGSISVSFTTVGIHTLTATYTGDANNAAATSAPLAQDVVNADSIALTSSVNPVVAGANTTLAATITYTGIAPTGTISFFDGSTIIGTVPVANAGGTLQASFATTGTHNLTCTYSGDINNAQATCNTIAEVVLNSASMTLTSSANPANVNQTTTFTATIASAGPAPTGTVNFFNGATLVCTANVAGGVATCATSFPAAGSFAIKAVYSGDNNTPTETATLTETVFNPVAATLTSSANPATVNGNVTFTATLTGFTTPTPTGTVSFTIDGAPFSTVQLTGTTASITTSFPTLSTHTVTCTYSGDNTYSQTPCNALTESVINPTTSVLTATPNPALAGQSVTLNAVVTSAGGNVPSGTVTFSDGTTSLGTVTLAAGAATLPISTLTPGPHSLTCTYSGDTADAPSACNTIADSVLNPSTIALTSSVNPSVVKQSVIFTATVTSSGTAVTGTVTFFNGTTALGTANVASGVATLSFTFPTAGTYPITAVYSGDSTHQTITSTTLAQVVLNLSTVVITSTVNPILMNNQTVLTAVVSSTGPTPTGVVTVFDGNAPLGNLTLVNGTVSFSTSFTYAGTHLLTAFYNGDPVTATSTSPAITETVGDFNITVAPNTPASVTVMPGASGSFSLVLTPIFTTTLPSAVTFSLQGEGTGTTSVFSPTVVAAGSGTTPVTLTLTAPQLAMLEHGPMQPAQRGPGGARILPMALALLALPLAIIGRRKRFLSAFLMLVFAVSLTGCLSDSSSGYFGQVPKTYSITVNASSGQLSRSTVVSLTIQ